MKAKSELGGNAERLAEMANLSPILDVNGEPIDPIWAAEFRGFFWGEGTLNMIGGQPHRNEYPNRHWGRHSFSIQASIGLRSDDRAVLTEFQRRLGGKLRIEPYRDTSEKTITRWVVATAKHCLRIAHLLESPTGLPFRKARQLEVWQKAVETKLRAGATAGSRYSNEDHAFMLWACQELRRLKEWTG